MASWMASSLLSGGVALMMRLRGAGPGQVDFVLGDVDIVEAGEAEQMVQFAFVGEAEDVRRVWRRRGDIHVFQEGLDHRAEKWILFHGAPGDEGDAAAGLKDAAHFAEGFLYVGNEHDAEAAGNAVEHVAGKWELLGVGGAEVDVLDAAGGGVFFGDFEHFSEKIGGGDAAFGADGGRDAESGFAGAGG